MVAQHVVRSATDTISIPICLIFNCQVVSIVMRLALAYMVVASTRIINNFTHDGNLHRISETVTKLRLVWR